MSAACVRNISAKARREWLALAERGVRMPGFIPEDDFQEIERLLLWLSGTRGLEQENKFETASSDVYALAIVLRAIGFDLLSTRTYEDESSQSLLEVV